MRILLTGASGFLGQGLLPYLVAQGHQVTATSRQAGLAVPAGVRTLCVPELSAEQDWQAALAGQALVIHSAARVHVLHEHSANPLTEYRQANVAGTLNLAQQAVLAGVRRFIFISSIKVNGEVTALGQPFRADDPPAPEDAYGQSKWEAEQGLLALARQSELEVCIIRPVLMYGPGVKANFQRLLGWLASGLPLPLGAVHNQRSLVARDNVVDLIATCCTHPVAVNQIFLVSDGVDFSTPALLRRLGLALQRPAWLWPLPVTCLEGLARLLGKTTLTQRLCGSLQVDITKTCRLLDWQPPVAADAALQATAEAFLRQRKT